ncbi:MAG: hypothetical protein ACOX8Q_06230 [Christensenellales bacterium]|jgi:hypothetical protein
MKDIKHFGLRIDAQLLLRFHQVCEYEGRSANAQILYLIRKCVEEYEKSHKEGKGQ